MNAAAVPSLPAILSGTLTLYQLYDIGDAIDLDLAQACLAAPGARRRASAGASVGKHSDRAAAAADRAGGNLGRAGRAGVCWAAARQHLRSGSGCPGA